mmetsp:Transcript_45816/g.58839  ORF Transcript_45816/g.58839 Transcript_45816/m.58839 type:complete len:323 (-) Transcript_45816:196-1164(-)
MFLGCPHDPNSKGIQKECPCKRMPMFFNIHTAAAYGDLEGVRNNILKKPDRIDSVDQYGYTPLHLAAQGNYVNIVKLLIDYGSQIDGFNSNCLLNETKTVSYKKCTPLLRAAASGALDCCIILLDHGANIEAVDESFGDFRTPFLKACHIGHLKLIKLLISYGANINAIDSKQMNAMDIASDFPDILEYFSNFKFNLKKVINLKTNEGIDSPDQPTMSSSTLSSSTDTKVSSIETIKQTSLEEIPTILQITENKISPSLVSTPSSSSSSSSSSLSSSSVSFGLICPACSKKMIVATRSICCKKLVCKTCRNIAHKLGCSLCP